MLHLRKHVLRGLLRTSAGGNDDKGDNDDNYDSDDDRDKNNINE